MAKGKLNVKIHLRRKEEGEEEEETGKSSDKNESSDYWKQQPALGRRMMTGQDTSN